MNVERAQFSDLLTATRPAVCFLTNVGDAMLTLPTLRALGEMFSAPLTLICPKVAFDLCFWELGARFVDATGLPLTGSPPMPGRPVPPLDVEALVSEIGAVDVFIDTLPWNSLAEVAVRPLLQRLAPTTSIGFTPDIHDIVVPKDACHAADLTFALARLFDPSLQIESFAQPVPLRPPALQEARSIRAAVPAGVKVLVVHADAGWTDKRWPITRFIDLLDRFLSRHRDFVAWVVGMGHEELNVGRERDRIVPYLGLSLDLAVGLVANADLFVGVDSSMLHAADLARVPGVGLFGRTRAAMWGFRFTQHRHVDMSAMEDITVDDVLAAMEDLALHVSKPAEGIGDPADISADANGPIPSRPPDATRPDPFRDSVGAELLSAVRRFYDTALSWHSEEPIDAPASGSIAAKALDLHALNFALWHHEDAARRPGIDDFEVARRKRCIDDLNVRRNTAVEYIDLAVLESIDLNPSARLSTETPGIVIDRLSVLTLRILHANWAEQFSARSALLNEQRENLLGGLEEFLAGMQAGRVTFKLYRQFKSAGDGYHCDLFDDRDI